MKNNGLLSNIPEGKTLDEIESNTLKDIWKPLFLKALNGKRANSEFQYNHNNYLIWAVPVADSQKNVHAGIAITQNITEDRHTKRKLKRSKDEAEEANRAKSEFLARVSHEIRTPLNAILGFAEQLQQTSLNSKQQEYIKIIDKSSEHLLSLINDILVLSKIEARQINFDKNAFKIVNTVKYVFNTLKAKAREKRLQFTYSIDSRLDVVLLGDTFRLRQILINLLNNAIKFTQAGYVELKCLLKEETGDELTVRFDVIDTGIGISADKIETVFDQFKQADSSITKKYGGTGLGLTICKNLIHMQNGTLSVSSQQGIGSTFSFALPYKKGKDKELPSNQMGEIDAVKTKRLKSIAG
ncbi:MAG: hypothetical protein HC896_04180 [Bacteroidales bacterium]|nr:hypothetical protein [Bacteroidales bacterium]